MKVLHAFNRHRGGGGSDNAWDATIRLSRARGLDVVCFERDSRSLSEGLGGKLRAAVSGVYSREGVREFRRALATHRPDLVHTHELYPLISPWILPVCAEAGVPVVHTCYDFRLSCPVATHFSRGEVCTRCVGGREYQAVLRNCRGQRLESAAYALRNAVTRRFRLLTDHVAQFLVLTDFSRRWLVEQVGVDEARVQVNPCVIPLPETAADPAAGGYVGFAGRYVPEKGVDVLLEAAGRTDLPVVLAGNSGTPPAPRTKVRAIVTRSPQELADFYRGARMLVVPSLWYETFGIVAAEAMSHGIPVVASRLGALQDTVRDGISGLLFDHGDAAALAEKLTLLWNDPALCRRLGANARRQVAECYDEAGHFQRLLHTYERALAQPAPLAIRAS